jgi:hypothetical protein
LAEFKRKSRKGSIHKATNSANRIVGNSTSVILKGGDNSAGAQCSNKMIKSRHSHESELMIGDVELTWLH